MSLSAFIQQHRSHVSGERDLEMKETEALQSSWPLAQLQKLGYALIGLRITSQRTGMGGKLLMALEPSSHHSTLPPNLFRAGDIVGIESPASADRFSGIVAQMSDKRMAVAVQGDSLVPVSEWKERCTVRKLANDITYRRIFRALDDLESYKSKRPPLHDVLFDKAAVPGFDSGLGLDVREFFDGSLNESQKAAVRLSVRAQDIALIHGPPGTGKTHTVVEVIRQLAIGRQQRVLVCGPSNISVDNIVERLGKDISRRLPIVRIGHPARLLPGALVHSLDVQTKHSDQGQLVDDVRKDIDQAMRQISKCKRGAERRELYSKVRELRKEYREREAKLLEQTISGSRVVLATLSGAASWELAKNRSKFDAVVIDEATQAIEGECWIAALQAPKLVLAGDHHQLPPTIKSCQEKLEFTLFERVRRRFGPDVCCMLTTQYRMHQDIMGFSSRQLYEDRLVADPSVAEHLLCDLEGVKETEDTTQAPLVLIDTASQALLEINESEESQGKVLRDSDSKLNYGEAEQVARHVNKLMEAGLPAKDIAIISPYNAQVRLLKNTLQGELELGLEIGSVDGFQGREKEAVVLSLVRSNDQREIGFLADYRRINVAITRARRHLCIVGDSRTVGNSDSKFLRSLFEYLEENAIYQALV